MAAPASVPKPSFMDLTDDQFLASLNTHATFKLRSYDTHHTTHLPELNARLGLSLDLPPAPPEPADDDPFAAAPNLSNESPIQVVYLGNSMLERLRTTGLDTQLNRLAVSGCAWNAGCGGDRNEHVLYRLSHMYPLLQTAQASPSKACDIKLWVLASGTNNLHPKRGLRPRDVETWKMVLQSCLRIAPQSRVLACDVFERKDVRDELVGEGNETLRLAVEEVNRELSEEARKRGESGNESEDVNDGLDRVVWVEAKQLIGKDMLVDHVHLNEEGYEVWDRVLWPRVAEVLGEEC